MYEQTKKDCYKLTAQKSEQIMDKCFEHIDVLDHDSGFQWHIMSGAAYRLTGDKASRNRNLIAAMSLASRYNIEGDYIRAWNDWEGVSDNGGKSIIDCMMNLPQLYFASKELNDDRFKAIAVRHANMAMRDHIRPDGSVNHIVMHDMKEPRVIETLGGQGYGVGSSWSRGQAWALYGFVLSYIHTGNEAYLDTAKRVANYFISCVAATDYLPLIDFRAPDEPVYYDSTAGAIAACGLIEIAKSVPEYEKGVYLDAAIKMLRAMEEKWCDWTEKEDSILQMGSERYGSEMHMPIIYGDYFFAEAIIKLRGSEFLPW
jgi:unsaturated chondroitin disaccharide hydrolase